MSVVRKMSITENYEGGISLVRSDISRFSGGVKATRTKRPRDVEAVRNLLLEARRHLAKINSDGELTETDKERLKRAYIDDILSAEDRGLLQKYFPQEFGTEPKAPDGWIDPKSPALAFLRKKKSR